MKPVVVLVAAVALVTAPGTAEARSVKAPDQVAPSPALPAGAVKVHLSFSKESAAAWGALAKLGWVQTNELRVMAARNGQRVCLVAYEGTLPAANLAAARKVPGVEGISPIPPSPRP